MIEMLSVFAVVALIASAKAVENTKYLSVNYNPDDGTYSTIFSVDSNYDAYGTFYHNYNASNWNFLDANMQQEVSSVSSHLEYTRALGYLEGYITCEKIQTFYPNFYSAVFGADPPGNQTLQFVRDNYDWMKSMIKLHASKDNYWYTIQTVLTQLEGMFDGYVAGCPSNHNELSWGSLKKPTLEHFLLLNAWGDLYQITLKYFEPGRKSRFFDRTDRDKRKLVERCSAIIKILPNFEDVVFGHATWDSYESLGPRILKHYSFPLMRNGYAEHHYDVSFSSSPGLLSSVDDFFLTQGYGQLAVIETTNNLYNVKLLEQVVPNTVLSWARAVASNQLSANGNDWASNFARYHSGTYTNQWMVLDLKLFTPGHVPGPGFFTVTEEVPGLITTADMTSTLVKDTYWGSYNNPYFEDISEASGYAGLCKRRGDEYCYNACPRANLFREYHSNIVDLSGAEWILGYNSFQNDTASLNDSCNAIACRGDLEPEVRNRGAYGALDAKVSSVTLAAKYPGTPAIFRARAGPSHDQQPVFCWSQVTDESDYVHQGQPDCFDFTWNTFPPKATTTVAAAGKK